MSEDNVPIGCLPFDIEAVKKGAKVITREGSRSIYIGDSESRAYPHKFNVGIISIIFDKNGCFSTGKESPLDLFLVDPNYTEQPYKVTMVATSPEDVKSISVNSTNAYNPFYRNQQKNPEFEFKQEIAAQFVLDWLRKKDLEYEPAAQVIQKGLDEYQEFLKQCKERFQK